MSELMTPELMTPEQVAEMLSVKPSWVRYAVRRLGLPHVRIGRHLRLVRADVLAWTLDQGGPR